MNVFINTNINLVSTAAGREGWAWPAVDLRPSGFYGLPTHGKIQENGDIRTKVNNYSFNI